MKMIYLLVVVAITSHLTFSKANFNGKTTVKRRIQNQGLPQTPKERRLNFDDELQLGSSYVQQLENTNANLSELSGHTKNQLHMKKIGQLFGDVEERLDDFRDSIARKLNELHMALQRPKVPIMGPAAMMLHPSMNPVLSSVASSLPSVPHVPESFYGPAVNSQYSALLGNSQISATGLGSRASAINSNFNDSVAKPERMLKQADTMNFKKQNLV